MTELGTLVDDGHCIACGAASEFGLHMHFTELPDGSVESRATVPPRFQGWSGVVHGGIVALLLDEAMAYAAGVRRIVGVTGELKMRFRKPVPTGAPLLVRGNVTWERRGVLGVTASVSDAQGNLLASAEGRFVSRGTLAPGERFGNSVGR